MHVHYFQHVPFEGLGSIEPLLKNAGHKISKTAFYNLEKSPQISQIDALIVMGGPMSVNDEAQFPWLVEEKKFIRDFIHSRKPVLGICLGAQLIASALGAKVYPSTEKEIGWFPIRGTFSVDQNLFHFPRALEVFHWHGETFDLPSFATGLARSEKCRNQAFQIGRTVIGLQFHLETTPKVAQKMVTYCGNELVDAPYIQTAEEILSVNALNYQGIHQTMEKVLIFLLQN